MAWTVICNFAIQHQAAMTGENGTDHTVHSYHGCDYQYAHLRDFLNWHWVSGWLNWLGVILKINPCPFWHGAPLLRFKLSIGPNYSNKEIYKNES